MKKIISFVVAIFASSWVLADENQFVQPTLKQVIAPQFESLAEASTQLVEVTESLSLQPSIQQLSVWRTQWLKTANAWQAARLYQFGPWIGKDFTPQSYYVESRLLKGKDYTKTVLSQRERILNTGQSLTYDQVKNQNFKYQGLLALEVLGFDTPEDQLLASPALLKMMVLNAKSMDDRIQAVNKRWHSEAYQMSRLSELDVFKRQIISSIWTQWGFIEKRILPTYGKETGYLSVSDSFWQQMNAMAVATRRVFTQDHRQAYTQPTTALGAIQASGYRMGQKFDKVMLKLISATEKKDIEAFKNAVVLFNGTMERSVVQALDVSLGFNFNDGD